MSESDDLSESDDSRLKKGFDAEKGCWVCDSDGEGSCYWSDDDASDWEGVATVGDDYGDKKNDKAYKAFFVNVSDDDDDDDDDDEEESVVVSDIGEYDTEDDDNIILEHLEALQFNFDELEMLGC